MYTLINTLQKKQEERFDGYYFFGVGQLEEEEENCQLGEVKKNHHKSVQSSDADTFFFPRRGSFLNSVVLLFQPNLIQIFALRFFLSGFFFSLFLFFFIYCAKYAKHTRAHGRILVLYSRYVAGRR